MPLMACQADGKSGFKFGKSGHCYPHDGTPEGIKAAKKAAVKQAIAIGGGKAPKGLSESDDLVYELLGDDASVEDALEVLAYAADAEVELASAASSGLDRVEDLPTVNLKGVELLAVGGPYHGQNSPPGGDHFDAKYLKTLAADTAAMLAAKELRPPNKVGHSRAQKLLEASGQKAISADEKPAAGWLHNVRYDAKSKRVLADIQKVPRKLARLIKAGAYRTRSVELRTLTSQADGKETKRRVITGLAWLGETAPAVRTLDDIVAMYGDDELAFSDADDFLAAVAPTGGADEDAEVLAALAAYDETQDPSVELAAGDVVWKPEEGYQFVRDAVNAALNPGVGMSRYWVRDVADTRALVTEYNGGDSTAWIVPFTRDGSDVTLAPSADWTKVEQAWVDASPAALSDALAALAAHGLTLADDARATLERVVTEAADTSGGMADENKTPALTDEQVTALAATFGIDETDDAKRRDAVTVKLAEFAPDQKPDDQVKPPAPPENGGVTMTAAELEVLRAKADRGDNVYEERRAEKRSAAIESALKDGRMDPAKKEFWETQFKEIDDDDRVVALLQELPVNEEFRSVYGSDLDPTTPEGGASADDAAYRAYAESLGYHADELPSLAKSKAA